MEYKVEDTEHSFRVSLGSFTICEIYYGTPRVNSPVSSEKAEEWATMMMNLIESEFPSSDVDEEEYKGSGMGDLMKLLMMKAMLDD